ncbi:MAG TPA: PAC2 family protein [Ilumatobacteraceae bacterium]|nr:PAC2 family protein [Ilumatobacteraceae bacterium]
MEHVRWLGQPTLHRPKLIAAFTGWNDAADAASNGVRHLVEAWQAAPLAEIDPEEFTDFATVRPHVRLTPEQKRTIVWPTVGLWSASTPGGDVILMLGPEPALRWRLFTDQVVAIANHFDASLVITLGALLADVPHSRPVQLMGTSTDQDVIDRFDLQRSRYEGPTGIVGVLQDACTRAGRPTASLWAAVPAYASQLPSPKATLALVQRTCEMIGTPAPVGRLAAEAEEYDRRVTSLVADDGDLIGYVARLESMSDSGDLDDYEQYEYDPDDEDDEDDDDSVGGELAEDTDVDSEELMAEVERFLRDQGGDS